MALTIVSAMVVTGAPFWRVSRQRRRLHPPGEGVDGAKPPGACGKLPRMVDLETLRSLLENKAPLTWVVTGDSITHGLRHTDGARAYADHLHEIVRGDLARYRDALVNTAISGSRITDILGDFGRRVADWSPQIVTLMIGTNDCAVTDGAPRVEPVEFGHAVGDFVSRVRSLGAVPVLQTPPPVDAANAQTRSRIGDFAQAVRDVAQAQGTILVDHFAQFLSLGGEGLPRALVGDPGHPGALGHAALTVELARVLGCENAPTVHRLRAAVEARGYIFA